MTVFTSTGRGDDHVVFFGYCVGTLLAQSIARLWANGSAPRQFRSYVWHADTPIFETSVSSLHNGRLILTAKYREKNGRDHKKLSSFDVKDGAFRQRVVPPRAQSAELSLPFEEDVNRKFVYCFASPFFELGLLHSYISETIQEEDLLSANALRDSIIKSRLPVLRLLLRARYIGLKFFVVEWAPYMFDSQVNALVHKEVVAVSRGLLKEYLKILNIPLVELPPDLVDENMFLSPRFMRTGDEDVAKGRSYQLRHPNQEFVDIMAEATLEFLANASCPSPVTLSPLDAPAVWPRLAPFGVTPEDVTETLELPKR